MNDINAPDVDGFSAGTGDDGSNLYVGYGDNSACGSQVRFEEIFNFYLIFFLKNPCPARVSTSPSGSGAYMSCTTGENYDPVIAMYLQTNPRVII